MNYEKSKKLTRSKSAAKKRRGSKKPTDNGVKRAKQTTTKTNKKHETVG